LRGCLGGRLNGYLAPAAFALRWFAIDVPISLSDLSRRCLYAFDAVETQSSRVRVARIHEIDALVERLEIRSRCAARLAMRSMRHLAASTRSQAVLASGLSGFFFAAECESLRAKTGDVGNESSGRYVQVLTLLTRYSRNSTNVHPAPGNNNMKEERKLVARALRR